MWANKIIDIAISVLAWVVLPVQVVTTLVLGILVTVTFGLLLIPFSIIWIVFFLGPLIGLSWFWGRLRFLRAPLAIIGIPLAILGDIYVSLIPSMGEIESRVVKLMICQTWPFSWECWKLTSNRSVNNLQFDELIKVLARLQKNDPAIRKYLSSQESPIVKE